MSNHSNNHPRSSVYDQLENARLSFQELDEKFLELQKMLLKIKKKNQDAEKPRSVLCVKIEIFDYFLKKLDLMLERFHSMSQHYEEIVSDLTVRLSESASDCEKIVKDLQNQNKCELLRIELNYNKLLETQAVTYNKKEKEMVETCLGISKELERTLKVCKSDLEETNFGFQELKQARINNKTKNLFLLDDFDKNLIASIQKIEEYPLNLPMKMRTLKKGEEESHKKWVGNLERNKLIEVKENQTRRQKAIENEKKCVNNDSNDSEISVFLANQLINFQEESRLNISMPKDEGKWDPALDSEKEENGEYSDVRKAFEIFDNLNLFEAENLEILQNFAEKCRDGKNLNSIDKSMFKELILQLLKLQKAKKNAQTANNSKLSLKPSNSNSPNNNELPVNIDDTNLNMTQIDNIDPSPDTDESKNPLEIKPAAKISPTNEFLSKKGVKNKDLSLSDLILDSSFLSPATGSKMKSEERGLRNLKREELEYKNQEILIEEMSSNKKSEEAFQKTMITNKNEPVGLSEEEKKFDDILEHMKENIRKEKEKLIFSKQNSNTCKNPESLLKSFHNKHHSEIFRSTPSASFLNHLNSNSETKLSANIEQNSMLQAKIPAKYRNHSASYLGVSQKSNVFQRISKKLTNYSLFFSNQTQTKLTTADFNRDIGFLQNIVSFGDDEGCSGRSEPIIIPFQPGTSVNNNFSKILNNNTKETTQKNMLFNCSFPGGKKVNRNKKQIFVKQITCYKENAKEKKNRTFNNKSLEDNNEVWGTTGNQLSRKKL